MAAREEAVSVEFALAAGSDNYCVFGNPVAHSQSPRIHAEFARQTRQNMHYSAVLVPEHRFAQAVCRFRELGGRGANVTLPFKQEAWGLCTERQPRAQISGAVNTLWFGEGGAIFGDNTDGVGLVRDITVNRGLELHGADLLVLGAGGAARGVIPALIEASPRRLVIANRTPGRALELAAEFGPSFPVTGCGFEALEGQCFDAIINATSASLHGEVPPLPEGVVRAAGWCYDLMYAREPTAFLRWAAGRGIAPCVDGLGMLVEQAAESFRIWRGVRPQTRPIIDLLRSRAA
ncbi:MAG: Shikimate dehydrogenase (NADP(+)) [Gammaproteobacteria bacterium]|nr:Shikimate dehydrogenase (NADP(+)) [Gammaproteobacteria bacterium]